MSSNSSVIISGLVVLEDPRVVSPRVTVFTAAIYVGSENNLLGSLRYFKDDDDGTVEYPQVGLYHLTFAAAKREPEFEVYTQDAVELEKLVFVGDIKKLCLLEALEAQDSENSEEPMWTIDPRQRVSVHVCCAVTTDNQQAATFTATPEQYTSAFADTKRAAETNGVPFPKSTFPLLGSIPDSHRFKGIKKPTPYSNRYCGFTGYLTGMSSALEGTKVVDRFTIDVDTVAFLGNVVAALPKATPTQQFKGGLGGNGGNGGSGSGSGSNCRPRWSYASGNGNGKRKRHDEDALSSSPSPHVGR
ncbi:hypothetical protein B0H19DRAFT_1128079 [Mycena capillaripes]|nr:hypothetical protein B0H19DRAFT_1128079 [Mycena capillaripes]